MTLNPLIYPAANLICAIAAFAMTDRFVGEAAAVPVVWVAVALALSIGALQFVLARRAKTRLLYQLLSSSSAGISLIFFLMAMFCPIFLIEELSAARKLAVAGGGLALMAANAVYGIRQVRTAWAQSGDGSFDKHYNATTNQLDWDMAVRPLGIRHDLYVPGLPEAAQPLLAVALLVFMLVGAGITDIRPDAGIVIWAVPMFAISAFFVQVLAKQAVLIRRLVTFETRIGRPVAHQPKLGMYRRARKTKRKTRRK
ncbi:hypothetical protein [Pseudoduganella buxea]|uniref:Uncharacterized protein n=1 Tax=Pseudoduganella buxea TaxID=1949069 RepID=A0A6I3SQ16_9BURK|nr:hypothetical protein [Pseudoduganella buxea]MTV51148.1 hypothetical protein [Pseudoduganella buxea]GGB96062.1 hypothetical protein GCM10011572_17560 [Pseudoduganella buxea]